MLLPEVLDRKDCDAVGVDNVISLLPVTFVGKGVSSGQGVSGEITGIVDVIDVIDVVEIVGMTNVVDVSVITTGVEVINVVDVSVTTEVDV